MRASMGRRLVFVLSVVLLAAPGCSICRSKAIVDAEQYAARGYETRIACYYLNLDGLLWGAFVWKSHCQAQVLTDDDWRWVGEYGGLRKTPTFSARGAVYSWTVKEYRGLLASHGIKTPALYAETQ